MNQQFMRNASFAVVMMVGAGAAAAGSQTANLAVTANVVANCTITTTPVAFGTYDTVAGTVVNATGAVNIACTKGAGSTITLGLGANASGAVRKMISGVGDLLTYELYQQPTTAPGTACNYVGATVWGTAGANIFTPTAAPSKASRSYNVCGQIAAAQDVPAANYSDTVVATVNF